MGDSSSEGQFKITITGFKGEKYKDRVAAALSRVFKNVPEEKIRTRLDKLPWAVLQRANLKNSAKVSRLLEKCGAVVEVSPPLPLSALAEIQETQVLSDALPYPSTGATTAIDAGDAPGSTPKPAMPEPIVPGAGIQTGRGPDARIESGYDFEPRPTAFRPQGKEPQPPVFGANQDIPKKSSSWELEPLSVSEILDRTFQICKANFWKLFAINAVAWAINLGVIAGMGALSTPFWIPMLSSQTPSFTTIIGIIILAPILIIGLMIVHFLAQGALIRACSAILLDHEITVKEAYSFALRKNKDTRAHLNVVISSVILLLFVPRDCGGDSLFADQFV